MSAVRIPGVAGSIVLSIVLLLVGLAPAVAIEDLSASQRADIEVFVRTGCPHCEKAKLFLQELGRERPALRIVVRDLAQDPHANARLREIAATHNVQTPRVPAFYVGGQLLMGYSDAETSGKLLKDLVDRARPPGQDLAEPGGTCAPAESLSCEPEYSGMPVNPETIEIAFLGRHLSAQQLGLPLFTLALGLLDGFNPCSMWVLILMISLLATMKDRVRMLLIAGTFVAVEGLAYFLFMGAWLNLFVFVGLSRASEVILGAVAILAGAISLKDFWAFGWGISLSIPAAAKPDIYGRIRRILQAEDLTAALAGVMVLAVLVQVVELLCTSGFPALYTRILTLRQLDWPSYYGYLLLYNLAYVLDDIIVLGIGVITLSQHRLQEKEGRWLKLVSGLVMVGLGLYLIAFRG